MALADALLLPSDDLTFACLLTSPLGGLTDDELSEIAMDRPGIAVGHAARLARTNARRGVAPRISSGSCSAASITSLLMRCLPRLWARLAAGLGCSPA